jgi:hypothetical protein
MWCPSQELVQSICSLYFRMKGGKFHPVPGTVDLQGSCAREGLKSCVGRKYSYSSKTPGVTGVPKWQRISVEFSRLDGDTGNQPSYLFSTLAVHQNSLGI